VSPSSRRFQAWIRGFGRVGYIAKGVAFSLAGALLLTAVLLSDPERVGGLGHALTRLGRLSAGPYLLSLISAGLFVNAMYLVVRAIFLPRDGVGILPQRSATQRNILPL